MRTFKQQLSARRVMEFELKLLGEIIRFVCLFVFGAPVGQGLLIHEVSISDTTTHHSRWESSGRVISPTRRNLPENPKHLEQTDVHAPGGIRTHNLRKRAAAGWSLRPRGQSDRRRSVLGYITLCCTLCVVRCALVLSVSKYSACYRRYVNKPVLHKRKNICLHNRYICRQKWPLSGDKI